MIYSKVFTTTINTITNPIIVTNGKELVISNDSFLSFFNSKSVEEFVKDNSCVCNLFIKDKDYFSLDLIDDDVLWTDYIYDNNSRNKMVSILDNEGKPNIFAISINKLPEFENQYIVVFTNITAIQNEKKLLKKMAYSDPLTNIYNRQMFGKMMIKEKGNQKRHGDNLSLIMLDIDHFKAVNDLYGHDIGDKVLITLTKLISKNLRTNDIFARWGGEEFIILLPRTDKEVAYYKAQELRKVIEEYNDYVIPQITVSFGVTEVLDSDKEQSAFIRVDKALYNAKIKRNDVVKI